MSVQSACEGCIQFPVTFEEFLFGIDTAKTDLSSHSALKAFILFDNIYTELGSFSHKEKVCKLYIEVGRKFGYTCLL